MEIQPISRIGGAALPAILPGAHSPVSGATSAQSPLAEDLSVEAESIEQRANDGDLMALEQLAQEEAQITPVDSQQLLPLQPVQSPPVHEAGKGDIIDIYD
jgi:hypothetical protein